MSKESIQNLFNLSTPPVEVFDNAANGINLLSKYKNVPGIYGYLNKKTNQVYIGSAKDLFRRVPRHTYRNTGNKFLYEDIQKYGLDNFCIIIFYVFESDFDIDVLLKKEEEFISIFKANYKIYNILELPSKGSYGYSHTEEAKSKISAYRTGKLADQSTKDKLSTLNSGEGNPFFGKNHTEEFKTRLSDNRKGENNPMFGREKSPEFLNQQNRDKSGANNPRAVSIFAINKDTGETLKFGTMGECAAHFKASKSTLIKYRDIPSKYFRGVWIIKKG